MAGYKLLIKPSAAKEIEAIGTKPERKRIVTRIQALSAEPLPPGCEKLAGTSTLFRVRQGQFRVVYAIDNERRIVEIIKVGHRSDVYRRVR